MKFRLAFLTLVLCTLPAVAADIPTAPTSASAAFNRLKSLVGQWDADTNMGKLHLTYELVSGGHVLLERESSDSHPTMVTAYYLDGGQLVLTHYCMLGNVPHMVARKINLDTGEITFDLANAANLAGDQAEHMHAASIRLLDADHFASTWTLFENAKPKLTITAQYARVR
jgi:hypothetical protein